MAFTAICTANTNKILDASKVDFRNPENFMHDVNSVAGLLKQFFRDLPDPLLTAEHYAGFIEASSMSTQPPHSPTTNKTQSTTMTPSAETPSTPSSTASPTPTTPPSAR